MTDENQKRLKLESITIVNGLITGLTFSEDATVTSKELAEFIVDLQERLRNIHKDLYEQEKLGAKVKT